MFCMGRHENIFPCTGGKVITSYKRIASCAATKFHSPASESQGNSSIRYYAKCPNHSAMTRLSKTDWY